MHPVYQVLHKIDVKKEVVQALSNTGLPISYELFIDESKMPCISYIEIFNADRLVGDSLEYADIAFQISLWTKDIEESVNVSSIIDTEMKALGFSRRSCNELINGSIIQKIFRYEAIVYRKLK